MVEEYIPLHLFTSFSPIFTTFSMLGTLVAVILGLILPKDGSTKAVYDASISWRILFGFPAVLIILLMLYFLIVIDTESPKFYLMKNTPEDDARAG
jgi:MFS family permease